MLLNENRRLRPEIKYDLYFEKLNSEPRYAGKHRPSYKT